MFKARPYVYNDEDLSPDDNGKRDSSVDEHSPLSLTLDWDNIDRVHINSEELTEQRDHVQFCTGSVYSGQWNALGMTGLGHYTYPYGVEYNGEFQDGQFHGKGTLTYPMGQQLKGFWQRGQLIKYQFLNAAGLEYENEGGYCKMPDRRFLIEIQEEFQPPGCEYLTNQQPTRAIEHGCYDTGDGFFYPDTKVIVQARDPQEYASGNVKDNVEKLEYLSWINKLTQVSPTREKWIKKNCRKSWDEPTGYRPELYRQWVTGRREELEKLDYTCQRFESFDGYKSLGESELIDGIGVSTETNPPLVVQFESEETD